MSGPKAQGGLDLGRALALAFTHFEADRPVEAARLARDLARVRPDLPGLDYLQGLLALKAGDGRKAAQHLKKAVAASGEAPPLLLSMARAQALQGRNDEAIAVYRRLLALDPDKAGSPELADANEELAALLLAANRLAESLEPLGRAVAARPDKAALRNNLGIALMAAGRATEALDAFEQALSQDGALAGAHANRAGALRRLGRAGEAVAAAESAVVLAPGKAAFWLELGQAKKAAGDPAGALAALSEARSLAPDETAILALLAALALEQGDRGAAQGLYARMLDLDPDDRHGARLELAKLGAAPVPDQAPIAHVRALFDQYADSFETDLVEGLGYRGPEILAGLVRRTLGAGPFAILDAGCGTGLAAPHLKPLASRLDGIDLSPRMIDKALAKGLYDGLEAGDLLLGLKARPAAYQLIVAADVLLYFGDLRPVLAAVHDALTAGGAFAFTVERAADEQTFLLQDNGRYAHGEAYLRRIASGAGFALKEIEAVSIRREKGRPVDSLALLLLRQDG